MTQTVAKDIAEYIEDCGHGTVGSTLFAGYMPDSPDGCSAILAAGGDRGEPVGTVEHPVVTIISRDTTYALALTRATNAWGDLHKLTYTTIESELYYRIDAVQSPEQIGTDEKGRYLFTCNYEVMKDYA